MPQNSDIALSWPAPPFENAFIGTVSGMLSKFGMTVRSGNPTFWTTPLEAADLYVIHWPDAIFWTDASHKRMWFWIARVLANLTLLKARGTRILWFVHNLQPHDLSPQKQRAWEVYSAGLSRLVDGWITLSPSTHVPVQSRYPALRRKRHTFIWHPPYADAYGGTAESARRDLGLSTDTLVVGHAGLLRPYKNLVTLAKRFGDLVPESAVLLLAGQPTDGVDAELDSLCGTVSRLYYRSGSLSPSEFDRALMAIDVFVAPYKRFLHSGALVHALSRGCTVVAPRTPFTTDLADAIGESRMVLYENELTSGTLARAAHEARSAERRGSDLSILLPTANEARLHGILTEMGLKLPVAAVGEHRLAR